MKIGMQTWGSHGDVRPFLALAEGLQADGHEVTLLITCVDSAAYAGVTSARGVNIVVLASPVVTPEQGAAMARTVYRLRNPLSQMAAILRLGLEPVEDLIVAAARQLAATSDLLIGHYILYPLQIAAEQAGRPYVSVLLSHAGVPSALNNPWNLHLGKTVNRLLWWVIKAAINRALKPFVNRLRLQLGMRPARDIVGQVWLSHHLTLVAVSAQICQAQADWPAAVHVCGFLDMPNMALEGSMPAAMRDFLDAGAAPVYMTLGSWMPHDLASQRDTVRLLTQAARLAGCRAIIQAGAWQACGFQPDQQVLYVGAAPHHAVFPRCAAVVHHGGAGTTQSATLAGVPSVVVAHINEQEHWGHELRRLGVAGWPLRRRSVTANGLARRIRQMLANPAMMARAEALAVPMRQEDGVATAVSLVQQRFVAARR